MNYYFAPMEGITGAVFRRTHHEFFPGIDKYFMPFITPTTQEKLTPRQKRDVLPEYNEGVPAVPQLLTRTAADFIWAANTLASLGYAEVNLNLGCPSGTVTAKGKGAGFLAHPDELDRFLDAVFSACTVPISIKTRLGVHDPAEFEALLEIYSRYPVAELTIHPRVRQDFYKGRVREDAFAAALPRCPMPVCYNGDLVSERGIRETIERYPSLFARYCEAFGDSRIAMLRMKELWFYFGNLFENSEKLQKSIKKAKNAEEFERAAAALFRSCEVRGNVVPAWFRPA